MPDQTDSLGGFERFRNSLAGSLLMLLLVVAIVALGAWLALKPPADSPTTGGSASAGEYSSVDTDAQAEGEAPEIDKAAPALTGTTPQGETVSLSDYAGKPVWVVFMATWCQACRAETPDIESLSQTGDINVLTIYMGEEGKTISDYAARMGLDVPALADPGEQLSANYRILGIPAHFFIDSSGTLRSTHVGAISKADAQAAIDQLRQ